MRIRPNQRRLDRMSCITMLCHGNRVSSELVSHHLFGTTFGFPSIWRNLDELRLLMTSGAQTFVQCERMTKMKEKSKLILYGMQQSEH